MSTQTTHQLSPQRIHYRHHPFYGAEVEVIRALRRCTQEVLIIQVPVGFQIAIPAWMLDPIHCGALPQEARPRLSLAALEQLLELLRAQELTCLTVDARTEITDAPKSKTRLFSEQLHLPQEGTVGKVSRTQSRSLSRTGRALTALRRLASNSNPKAK